MTTKEQERQALQKIRKIVDGLGEDSYIGTAFEGCFEIAEANIEDDFACSMKQRAEAEAREAEHFRALAGSLKDELDKVTAERDALQAATIDDLTRSQIRGILNEQAREWSRRLEAAGAALLEEIGNTGSDEFAVAVEEARRAKGRLSYLGEIIKKLQ